MMSRKHYVAVADSLNSTLSNHAGDHAVESALVEVAQDLARIFRADNGMFDRQRFFDAVTDGTSAGRIIA